MQYCTKVVKTVDNAFIYVVPLLLEGKNSALTDILILLITILIRFLYMISWSAVPSNKVYINVGDVGYLWDILP